MTSEVQGRRTNGKVIFQVIMSSIGLNFGTLLGPGRKPHSCGPFGTKHWWLMNGQPALRLCLYLNNVLYASSIRASQLNINFGTAPKREGFGVGLPHHA